MIAMFEELESQHPASVLMGHVYARLEAECVSAAEHGVRIEEVQWHEDRLVPSVTVVLVAHGAPWFTMRVNPRWVLM